MFRNKSSFLPTTGFFTRTKKRAIPSIKSALLHKACPFLNFTYFQTSLSSCKIKKVQHCVSDFFCDHDWIRTSTPNGTTPSRWHVYQFHHMASLLKKVIYFIRLSNFEKLQFSEFLMFLHKFE
jgi:hypothetical protein